MNNSKPDSKSASIYRLLGKIHLNKNGYDEAIQHLTETIEGGCHTGESHFHRAFVYFQKGEYSKSQADIDRAKEFGYQVSEKFIDNPFMGLKKEIN